MKYTAINIGPIVKTLQMGRKPRELWSASYLFSCLTRYIINEIDNASILSPAEVPDEIMKQGVGMYPDRIFIKGNIDTKDILDKAWSKFDIALNSSLDRDYFNVMSTSCEAEKDSAALKILNDSLDKLELINIPKSENCTQKIFNFISQQEIRFNISDAAKKIFSNTICEISACSLNTHKEWNKFRELVRTDDSDDISAWKLFGKDAKSYHKYFCIVQADGDSVGKVVTHKNLPDGKISEISEALLSFGKSARQTILDYGGMPIYAGGDDLLFIAPVIGNSDESNKCPDIFSLLKEISKCFNQVGITIDSLSLSGADGSKIKVSLSFGVAISYYKHPLYEAFGMAQNLLAKAKKIKSRNAVAWKLTKHSGSGFEGAFSYYSDLTRAFCRLIDATSDGNTVSSVIHKTREYDKLLKDVLSDDRTKSEKTNKSARDIRLDAIFEKVFEFKDTEYFSAVKDTMEVLYDYLDLSGDFENFEEGEKPDFTAMLYSLLRTARFIKGEDLKDE